MNTFILIGLVALCSLAAVEGLDCNVCGMKLPLVGCVKGKSTKTCDANNKCQAIKAFFAGAHIFTKLNCTADAVENCNVTQKTDEVFSFTYDKSCCTVDMCNSASALQLSLLAGFSTVITLLLKLS